MIDVEQQIVIREILTCGINTSDKVVHFGSGYNDNSFFKYLVSLKDQNLIGTISLEYTAVDVDESSNEKLNGIDTDNTLGAKIEFVNSSMQEFLDENKNYYDWSVITGLFDRNLYGDQQFQFIDKILDSCFNVSNNGIIFTFDVSKENDDTYTVRHIISYLESKFKRYRINKVNERYYVMCIYRHYYSPTN